MTPRPTFPRFSAKVRHPSLIEPAEFARVYLPGVRVPPRFFLVWRPGLAPKLARRFRGRRLRPFSDSYFFPGSPPTVGISLPRGVGGPTTILRAEELAAVGAREFIGVGYAGALSPTLRPGDVVVCDRAVRDEGTSHHYAHPNVVARPSATLNRWITGALSEARIPFRLGEGWTTDAPYRETREELRHYRKLGILTVDMEASALFIFARHRNLRAATVFVISDVLTERRWRPHFHRVGEKLELVASALVRASKAAER
jgi:uridine phosphorylase